MCMIKYLYYWLSFHSWIILLLYSASACTNGNIRLYNGTASVPDNGMLQICKSGKWLAVCDYRWTQSHSIVACKQLGYNNPGEYNYV